jgi:hypothetical protein
MDGGPLFFQQRKSEKENILKYIFITRQRLGKHIFAQAYARNNRTSIARQRTSQHASLTIEAVFFAWFVQSGYKNRSAA